MSVSILEGTELVSLTQVRAGDRLWLANVIVGDSVHGWAGPVTVRSARCEPDVKGRPYVVLTHDHPDLGTGVWMVGGTAIDGPRGHARRFVGEPGEVCAPCGREHQPRDHPVPCGFCRRMTSNFHAVCDRCAEPGLTVRQGREDRSEVTSSP